MASIRIPAIADVFKAESVINRFVSPAPLIRSYPLEKELGLPSSRRVWLKDYGWTPTGSFKLLGGLNWVANNLDRLGDRPIAAHSSGNFASGIAFAGKCFQRRVIVVMPQTAPRVKFDLTRSFGADIRTYDITQDHITGERDRLTREIAEKEGAIQASPYDDPYVIAGNGVGGLQIAQELRRAERSISHFVCPVSGGGLMAGHALAITDAFPSAQILGVEPAGANDFQRSLEAQNRVRLDHPKSICDGLLSYDVGEHNWPILQRLVRRSIAVPDDATRRAMKWIYEKHGLRTEPSGAISIAAVLSGGIDLAGEGDVVLVLSGRNVDQDTFKNWINIV